MHVFKRFGSDVRNTSMAPRMYSDRAVASVQCVTGGWTDSQPSPRLGVVYGKLASYDDDDDDGSIVQ